jgi:hypothetical protein
VEVWALGRQRQSRGVGSAVLTGGEQKTSIGGEHFSWDRGRPAVEAVYLELPTSVGPIGTEWDILALCRPGRRRIYLLESRHRQEAHSAKAGAAKPRVLALLRDAAD